MIVHAVHGRIRRGEKEAQLTGNTREATAFTAVLPQHTLHTFSGNGCANTSTTAGHSRAWDLASVHASEATLAAMKASWPHVALYFIPPQKHFVRAALRRGSFRSFKSCKASSTLALRVVGGSVDTLVMSKAWGRPSASKWASIAIVDLCDKTQRVENWVIAPKQHR